MKRRWHMRSKNWDYMVESDFSAYGLGALRGIRKVDPDFKYQRIKDVLQAYPDRVKLYHKTETT
jgi:hypothetical protein